MRPESKYPFFISTKQRLYRPTRRQHLERAWSKVIWDIRDEEVELRFDKSGEYGTLLFKNMGGDVFAVCLGVHNYNVWCGMTDDCTDDDVERVSWAYWCGDKQSVRW